MGDFLFILGGGVGNPLFEPQGWTITAEERSKYEELFPHYDSDGDGLIQGREAVELLGKSQLDRNTLKKVRTPLRAPRDRCPRRV